MVDDSESACLIPAYHGDDALGCTEYNDYYLLEVESLRSLEGITQLMKYRLSDLAPLNPAFSRYTFSA